VVHIQEKSVRRIFFVSLTLKGLNALLEIIGGFLFLFTGTVTAFLTSLVSGELLEDPTDLVANQIQHWLPAFTGQAQLFGAFYLLSHGIVKIFLVVNLLRNRLWAYPATIIVMSLFVIYQLYRLSYGYSIFLVLLTVFDVFIIVLTWHEYKLVSRHTQLSETAR